MIHISDIQKKIHGEITADDDTLLRYARDASLFEIVPGAVAFPKNTQDIQTLVKYVGEHKAHDPSLSITMRAAGTDMTGGPLNDSIIVDTTKYMNRIISIDAHRAIVEPGVFYRDMEAAARPYDSMMPAYTASKELNAIGGMVGNNSGGEKSIKYGKVERYVRNQKVILSDGNEYDIGPLTQAELEQKMKEDTFLGKIYRDLHTLIIDNYDSIQAARPLVSKNSAGYYLWNVYNKETGIFDLNKLIVGSQGTLAITTEATFDLVPIPRYSKMVVMYLPTIEKLGDIVDTVMRYEPESFESYDDYSMKLAIKYSFDFFKTLGFWNALRLGIQFIPDVLRVIAGGVPKLILMIEVTGDNEQDVYDRAGAIKKAVKPFRYQTHIATSPAEVEKYWKIRRESFNLLRKHIKGKRTAPFIDDIIVSPHSMPTFLPTLKKILDDASLVYTIAGHAGNGNFHIIPLMDLNNPLSQDTIITVSKKVYELVAQYKGSITAEHNDGIIRTSFLPYMYSPEIISLFAQVKTLFDPLGIFNPGKKVGGTIDTIRRWLIRDHLHTHGS